MVSDKSTKDEDQALETSIDEASPPSPPLVSSMISDEAWNQAIGSWVNDHLRSTPVAQNTDGWNHLMGVIPKLRELLETALK